MNLSEIKSQLRQFDQKQLIEVQTYIKGLMVVGTKDSDRGVDLLLPIFEENCRRYGLGYVSPPLKALVRKREDALKSFLKEACPDSSVVVWRSILALGIDLLYRDLQDNGRLCGARHLAYGLDRLPVLIDRAFPGYAACGLLAKVVRTAA